MGYLRELTGAEVFALKNLPLMTAWGRGKDAKISLYWSNVKDADGYEVYWSYCDGSKNYRKLTDTAERSISHTKLDAKKSYKYFAAAYKWEDGQKVYLAKSPTLHVAMEQDKYTNAAKVMVKNPEVVLKAGKTAKIEPRTVKEDAEKKLLTHLAAYRYYTTDKEVAVVSRNGKITAKKRGTCYIYVVANDGFYKRVKVTVK